METQTSAEKAVREIQVSANEGYLTSAGPDPPLHSVEDSTCG